MNFSRGSLACSICFSLNSQSPVSSGEVISSTPKWRSAKNRRNAFQVGFSSRPRRSTYFSLIRPSMTAARVAGVPRPFAPIASRSSSSSTSLPAPSIAESSVASLKRAGGRVWLAVAFDFQRLHLFALRDGGQVDGLVLQALAVDGEPAGALHDAPVGPEMVLAHHA